MTERTASTFTVFPPAAVSAASGDGNAGAGGSVAADATGWRVAAATAGGAVVHVVPPHGGAPATAAGAATAVARALAGLGYRGQAVVLAVPSAWCLCAPVDRPASARQRRRQAMLFRLEERLPLAAEDVAADFAEPAGPLASAASAVDAALGVAVPTAVAKPVVDALEAAGVRVEVVCPAAFLAAQVTVGDGSPAPVGGAAGGEKPPDACVWVEPTHLEWVGLAGGRPTEWSVLPRRPDALALRLAVLAGRRRGGPQAAPGATPAVLVHVVGADAATLAAARRVDGVAVTSAAGPALAGAEAAAGGRVLAGRLAPWVNLRQGPLAAADPLRRFRRPLLAVAAAAVVFLACLTVALFWRASQYRAMTRRFEADQLAAFRQAFPGQPPGAAPVSRLASEERRLTAAAGPAGSGVAGAGPAASGSPVSALPILYAALARLPEDVRYRVAELRVADGKLTLDGQSKTHADAEAVAAALRAGNGFAVELPRSEQVGGGGATGAVSFTLAATPGPGAAHAPESAAAALARGRTQADGEGADDPAPPAGSKTSPRPKPGGRPPAAVARSAPGAGGPEAAGSATPRGAVAAGENLPAAPVPPVRPALPAASPDLPAGMFTEGFGISAKDLPGDPSTRPSAAVLLHLGHVPPVTEWPPKLPPPAPSWLATPPPGKRLATRPARPPAPPADTGAEGPP